MEEYTFIITLGVIAVIVIIFGVTIRVKQAKAAKKKGSKEIFYQDAKGQYVDQDGRVMEDDGLYSMKEAKAGVYKGKDKEQKDDGKLESWKNY